MKSLSFAYRVTLFSFLVLIAGSIGAVGQVPELKDLKQSLADKAGFSEDDFALIERGGVVVKTLKANLQSEVSVLGLVRITASNEIALRAFHRTIAIQEKRTSKEYGEFGVPPTLADLDELTIDASELDDLKSCRVNSCKWNLPSAIIERIQSEIDWDAADSRKQADVLIRKILVEYVKDYSANGDSALFEYNDKPEAVILKDEYSGMQDSLFWVTRLSPRLEAYLGEFPNNPPPNIENTVNWSKIKIGLKNVIVLTQNITYPGDGQVSFVISKQIYANHYFDSTLTETVLVTYKDSSGQDITYLMFMNRSRAGAFKTTLGKLARGIVEGQAESRLEAVLKDSRKYSALAKANRQADIEAAVREDLTGSFWFSTNAILLYLLIAGAIAACLIILSLRRKR